MTNQNGISGGLMYYIVWYTYFFNKYFHNIGGGAGFISINTKDGFSMKYKIENSLENRFQMNSYRL